MRNKLLLGLLLLVLALLPLFTGSYFVHVVILILLFSYLSSSWNILGGYAGQFSFGHAVFVGIGAYTSTILYVNYGISPWIGMAVGSIFSTIVGVFIGFLCFRYGLKGPFFSLATLAFAEMFRVAALNIDITNKAAGILIPLKQSSLAALQFQDRTYYYYIILLFNVAICLLVYYISRSKLGDYFEAIREDEDAAEAVGIDTLKYKIVAIAISAFLTSLGGTFYAQYLSYIDPAICFGSQNSFEIFIRPILGGLGTVFGPFLGALILGPLSEISRALLGRYTGMHLMLFGAILVAVIMFLPGGVVEFLRKRIKSIYIS
jgi:branched-chain amino acid transport system permease protein